MSFELGVLTRGNIKWWHLPVMGAAIVLATSAHGEAPQKYFVTGSVFDEQTKQPIADANLSFLIDGERDPRKRLRKVSTDAAGQFRLEVPAGSVSLWFPDLKPGYWLDAERERIPLSTSPEQPVATLNVAVKPGRAWPVKVIAEGGLPDAYTFFVSVMELEADAARAKYLSAEPLSFQKSPNQASTRPGNDGSGALTECGSSGKFVVNVGAMSGQAAAQRLTFEPVIAELLVEPAFQTAKVKTVSRTSARDKTELIDENGAKATVTKAEVELADGRPLLKFRLRRKAARLQAVSGVVVDDAGKPLGDVRVGTVIGSASGSAETEATTNTDRQGHFRVEVSLLELKEPLHLLLELNKDGYAGFDSRAITLPNESAAEIDAGKFTLPRGHRVAIRVVDGQKRPLVGAVVEPSDNYALRRSQLRTDVQGRGTLENLPSGVVRLQLSHGDRYGRAHLVVSAVDAENTETELRLETPDVSKATEHEPAKPIAVGQPAPELAIDEWTDGKHRTLADYKGRVVVLDFWGIWCGPCLKSIPVMRDLAAKYGPREVVFLAIHTAGGDRQQIERLKRLYSWNAPSAIDRGTSEADSACARLYGVRGFPTVMVIDRQGKIAFNSSVDPQGVETFMKDMRELALSLEIPWPIPDDDQEQAMLYMSRIQAAFYGREIEKALGR